jgi:hypothetical protein
MTFWTTNVTLVQHTVHMQYILLHCFFFLFLTFSLLVLFIFILIVLQSIQTSTPVCNYFSLFLFLILRFTVLFSSSTLPCTIMFTFMKIIFFKIPNTILSSHFSSDKTNFVMSLQRRPSYHVSSDKNIFLTSL